MDAACASEKPFDLNTPEGEVVGFLEPQRDGVARVLCFHVEIARRQSLAPSIRSLGLPLRPPCGSTGLEGADGGLHGAHDLFGLAALTQGLLAVRDSDVRTISCKASRSRQLKA